MQTRRSRPATPRPASALTTLALGSSTAGWFAEWKARKSAPPTPASEPPPPSNEGGAEALAKWLVGNDK